MSTNALKVLVKNLSLAILFYSLMGCGKEAPPHPPFPKEKIIKDVKIEQIGDEILIEIGVPEIFKKGKVYTYLLKVKKTSTKEFPTPPESSLFKKKNLLFEENLEESNIWKKRFKAREYSIEENNSLFWGFYFKKGKEEEKTKIFQFVFLKNLEEPILENVEFLEEGFGFKLKISEECKNLIIEKSKNGEFKRVELSKGKEGLIFDKDVMHNYFYKYKFYCSKDENHLSFPALYEGLFINKFKPNPPEYVLILNEGENLRIEFGVVEKALKYKIYEKCLEGGDWQFLMETEKNMVIIEGKNCFYGVSSINEAGLESEIVEGKREP